MLFWSIIDNCLIRDTEVHQSENSEVFSGFTHTEWY